MSRFVDILLATPFVLFLAALLYFGGTAVYRAYLHPLNEITNSVTIGQSCVDVSSMFTTYITGAKKKGDHVYFADNKNLAHSERRLQREIEVSQFVFGRNIGVRVSCDKADKVSFVTDDVD